jgi:hypothetical protein
MMEDFRVVCFSFLCIACLPNESLRAVAAKRSLEAPTCPFVLHSIKAEYIAADAFENSPGFPALLSEAGMPRYLDGNFPRFGNGRRKIGVAGVRRGEELYRKLRVKAGLPPLPREALVELKSRSHTYWEIGPQAFIVSAWMREKIKISVTSAAMAYLLHDLDDVADRHLASFISKLSPTELNQPVGKFLEDHFPQGYSRLYELIMAEVQKELPYFDRSSFDKATMRMILGAALLSKDVSRAKREKFQYANKQQHVELLSAHPQIQEFLDNDVSNAFYSGTVKSLPDGIFAFFEQEGKRFDPALMVLFGILTVPGLVGENVKFEKENGEVTDDGLIDIKEVRTTLDMATKLLVEAIHRHEFDNKQLEAFLHVYNAYGDGFEKVLRRGEVFEASRAGNSSSNFRQNLWDLHVHSDYEINMAMRAVGVVFR